MGIRKIARPPLWLAALLSCSAAAIGADLARDAQLHGDIDVDVVLDPGEQSGAASANVRINARREVVWPLVTSCPEALTLIPGLVACEVLETAADQSWQRIRHVLHYSWYLPKLTYEIRASYDKPSQVSIERISGDLKQLHVSWTFQQEGDHLLAHYTVEMVPGFWVPRWLMRGVLERDLPKMLRTLRTRAESLQRQ